MIRPQTEVSAYVHRDGKHVVLRLNRENYRMTIKEAVWLADRLVDSTERANHES